MSIVQGDHGYSIPFITRKDTILDLTGASVEVAIQRGGVTTNKQANILDAVNGKCEVILSSADLNIMGTYTYQWTAYLPDGRILSGNPSSFYVKDKLNDLPPGDAENTVVVPFANKEEFDELKEYVDQLVIDGGGSIVTDGDTNGTIKVNNIEVLVYDDAGVLQRLEALESTPSDGSGSSVSDSSTNGNILVDGQEITVYDDTSVTEQLAEMVRSVNGVAPDANGNVNVSTGDGGTLPSNVIYFEDWLGGESVTIDTGTSEPPADTTVPVLTITSGGTFTGTKSVTMSTNETATIYYTLDGSTPTTSSNVYSSALSISATTTLKAFAVDSVGNSSAIQTVTYTLEEVDTTAPTVTATPSAGTYTSAQSVTLSADETATIYYTLDGSTPTTSSLVYSSPISIDTTTTIQFMAVDSVGNLSTPVSATYTINIPQDTTAPVLTITPAQTFTDSVTVTMSTDETATIWYTLDDTDPTTSATRIEYTAPITLTETDTIKAYAVDAVGNASAVQTVMYTKESALDPNIIVSDTFDRADSSGLGVADTGQSWTGTGLDIVGGYAQHNSGSLTTQDYIDIGISDNIEISADFTVPTYDGTISNTWGILFRSDGTALKYIFGGKGATNTVSVYGASVTNVTRDLVGTHNYKVRLIGQTVECYIDNELVITFTDSSNTANTKHGLLIYNTKNIKADNFIIKSI
jgi:hypothetical protein